MSDSPISPAPVPAGWYPDPAGGPGRRWWNGTGWTEKLELPYGSAPAGASVGAARTAPPGTAPDTVWIWLVALLPLASLLTIFTIDIDAIIAQAVANSSGEFMALPASSPGEILSNVVSFAVWGLSALFAFLDWRELKQRQVDVPFHFAWAILGSLVYVIGRSVIIRRRVGSGLAPMWAGIAVAVAGLVIGVVFVVQIATALLAALPGFAP